MPNQPTTPAKFILLTDGEARDLPRRSTLRRISTPADLGYDPATHLSSNLSLEYTLEVNVGNTLDFVGFVRAFQPQAPAIDYSETRAIRLRAWSSHTIPMDVFIKSFGDHELQIQLSRLPDSPEAADKSPPQELALSNFRCTRRGVPQPETTAATQRQILSAVTAVGIQISRSKLPDSIRRQVISGQFGLRGGFEWTRMP